MKTRCRSYRMQSTCLYPKTLTNGVKALCRYQLYFIMFNELFENTPVRSEHLGEKPIFVARKGNLYVFLGITNNNNNKNVIFKIPCAFSQVLGRFQQIKL
ncbi:hypothetical protein STEG23_007565 [Scotinomys teguina]